jgi:hypothetical protein
MDKIDRRLAGLSKIGLRELMARAKLLGLVCAHSRCQGSGQSRGHSMTLQSPAGGNGEKTPNKRYLDGLSKIAFGETFPSGASCFHGAH